MLKSYSTDSKQKNTFRIFADAVYLINYYMFSCTRETFFYRDSGYRFLHLAGSRFLIMTIVTSVRNRTRSRGIPRVFRSNIKSEVISSRSLERRPRLSLSLAEC